MCLLMALELKRRLTSYQVYIVERHIAYLVGRVVGLRIAAIGVIPYYFVDPSKLVVVDSVDQPLRRCYHVDRCSLELMNMS